MCCIFFIIYFTNISSQFVPYIYFCCCLLFYFLALQPAGSSSPTRDRTCAPALGVWCLNHCTTVEVPVRFIFDRVFCADADTYAIPLIGSAPNSSAKL